ncbi:MAG: DUF421 domain-containing protein [Sarcina sp.]
MFIIFIRTIILYFTVIISIRLMGKRQLGEMQPYELAVTMMLSDLASLPMQDTRLPLLLGIIPLITLLLVKVLLIELQVRFPLIRNILDGRPIILIENGNLNLKAIKEQNLAISDLMEAIRESNILHIEDIELGILENNGKFSFFTKTKEGTDKTLPLILLFDGKISEKNLKTIKKDRDWLTNKVAPYSLNEILIIIYNSEENILIQKRESLKGWEYVTRKNF